MAEHVVGEWKDFVFEMATGSDCERIFQHVRDHFLKDELMNTLLGPCPINIEEHRMLIEIALKHQLSFLVLHKSTKEIAGVQLCLDSRLPGIEALPPPKSLVLQKILSYLIKLDELGCDALKNHDAPFHAEILISSVSSNFRGQGLALEMYRRTLLFLQAKGFPIVKSEFTSPGTRAIGQKLGFIELARFYHKDHVDENGEPVFPTAVDQYATAVVLPL